MTDAAAAEATVEQTGCAVLPVRKAFSHLGDTSDYTLAPGGDFETAAGWGLSGGAKIAAGNETLGIQGGQRSLQLPIGATALSPEFCVDETKPHFRFVTRPDGAVGGYNAIVLYRDTAGNVQQAQFTSSKSQTFASGKWGASSLSPLATKIPLVKGGKTATVQILFVSTGNAIALSNLWGRFAGGSVGTVSVDSLMVDPYRRG